MKTITLYRNKDPKFLNMDVEIQKEVCRKYAEENDLVIIEEYVGIGFGTESDADYYSDAIANIKDAAANGEMKALLVYSYYCIGREDIETPIAIQSLLKKGVRVISIMEGSFT